MACWSAENATKAYLKTMKMGKRAKEPDAAEFISALAAGNNAQLMVVACGASTSDYSTTLALALAAAAHQTGGHVVCILRGLDELHSSKRALGHNASDHVEFIVGEAQNLLMNDYRLADFVVIDCNLENHQGILSAVQASRRHNGAVVLGYNAFCKDSWRLSGSNTQLLPIGEGLLLTRIAAARSKSGGNGSGFGKRSRWVVKVDKYTGEEHVFRVRSSQGRVVEA